MHKPGSGRRGGGAAAPCVTREQPRTWAGRRAPCACTHSAYVGQARARPDARLARWKTLDVVFLGLVVRTVRLWVLFFCVCFGTFCFELKMSVTPWPRMSPSQSARRLPAAPGARPGLNKLVFSWLFTDVRPSAASGAPPARPGAGRYADCDARGEPRTDSRSAASPAGCAASPS